MEPKITIFGLFMKPAKTGYILLLVVSATPLLLMLGWQLQQQYIRHQMRESLETQLLHSITLHPPQVHWIETDRELLINGELFDVRSTKLNDDGSYTFLGLFDDEESDLLAVVQKKMNERGSGNLVVKLLRIQLFLPDGILSDMTTADRSCKREFTHFDDKLAVRDPRVMTPPPKV